MRSDFKRDIVQQLLKRIGEPRRFIQVVTGPRQVGKTTAVHQLLQKWQGPAHYATADLPAPPQPVWIEQQWNIAKSRMDSGQPVVLVLDEVQKVMRWSEVLKNLWDEDKLQERDVRVIILGSSSLLVQAGLTESLAGRFEILHATHWTFAECQKCFGWNLEEYLYFGGYPGAAPLKDEPLRWAQYIREALIETILSKDVLMMNRVDKPVLLRQLFMLATEYSGQIISYQKLIGQLQDAGNTTTLAHYQHLLEGAGLIKGIPKWHGKVLKRRASSPKWIVLNTALMTAISGLEFATWRQEPSRWGRLVETAVGAHLINSALGTGIDVYYWRDRNREVDFVLQRADQLLAVEVKSGLTKGRVEGVNAFKQKFPHTQLLLVGGDGIPLEELLQRDITHWFETLFPKLAC